jgi:hypothetical protein
MITERWRYPVTCGACDRTIAVHEPVYLVTTKRLPRCELCARSITRGPLQEPPALHAQPLFYLTEDDQGRRRRQDTIARPRFDRDGVAATVRRNILDARQRQAGERE